MVLASPTLTLGRLPLSISLRSPSPILAATFMPVVYLCYASAGCENSLKPSPARRAEILFARHCATWKLPGWPVLVPVYISPSIYPERHVESS